MDAARIQELAKGHYPEKAHNLILVGGTGTGKTHLAIAPGVAAIHHGKRIRFCNAVDQNVLPFPESRKGKTPWSIVTLRREHLTRSAEFR